MTAQPEAYMHAFRDIVFDLVQLANESGDKGHDYQAAILKVLGDIKGQAVTFDLDLKYLGLAEFDPEVWFAAQP